MSSCQTGPKGQNRVSEFNLITWEGPAEPEGPFIQFTLYETKENMSSGARITENLDIPSAFLVFRSGHELLMLHTFINFEIICIVCDVVLVFAV